MSDVGEDPALIGRTIAGKFVIEKFLGGGAMGAVYRAKWTALSKTVAIKVMHRDVASDPQFAARFAREAKAASLLDHPNSVRVIDFGQEPDGPWFIAMEFVEGRDLYKVIHEDWPISDARIIDVLSQALAAIAVGHEAGIIHRDLKPENIMLLRGKDDEGREADVVKVCDFGIAKIQEKEEAIPSTVPAPGPSGTAPIPEGRKLTTQGLVVGTPEYMSPEQARGEKLDARSDLYSMGIILYQLLTGRTPFTGDNALSVVLKHITEVPEPPRAIYGGVNPALEAVCLKAIAKLPADRFQTAREMRTALRAAADGQRPTPVDVSAPTLAGATASSSSQITGPKMPLPSPVATAATTAPTIAELPAITTNAAIGSPSAEATPAKKKSSVALVIALVAVAAAAAGTAAMLSRKNDAHSRATAQNASDSKGDHSSSKTAEPSNATPPPAQSLAMNNAVPVKHDPSSPMDPKAEKHLGGHKAPGKHPTGPDTNAPPEPPPGPTAAPPPTPEPPPTVAPAPPPPATTTAPAPPPAPPPAPAFNSATCHATQTNVVPHGVLKNDLSMKGTVEAWTACAHSTIKERPGSPINATVHLQFTDSRQFRGATCAGCPPALAACVSSDTGRTVSLQFKSGDVTGDPSFDVGVTFSCD